MQKLMSCKRRIAPSAASHPGGVVALTVGLSIAAFLGINELSSTRPLANETHTLEVNTSRWEELLDVEGIGDTLAMRIVESRDADGPFETIDELTRVRGIGEKSLAKMRRSLRVDAGSQ